MKKLIIVILLLISVTGFGQIIPGVVASSISYASLNELFFGSADDQYHFYNGLMDEVAIRDRALTDTEVTTLFNKTPYPF